MQRRLTLILFLMVLTLACSATAPGQATATAAPPTPQPSPAPIANNAITIRPTPTQAPLACIVTADALNIRTCPGVACAVSGWLQAGQTVTLANIDPSGWANLTAGGWIYSSFINCEAKP